MQNTARANLGRCGADAVPIEFAMLRDRGYIGDPQEALPKMFCAVNTNEDQLVFKRQYRNGSAVKLERGGA